MPIPTNEDEEIIYQSETMTVTKNTYIGIGGFNVFHTTTLLFTEMDKLFLIQICSQGPLFWVQ